MFERETSKNKRLFLSSSCSAGQKLLVLWHFTQDLHGTVSKKNMNTEHDFISYSINFFVILSSSLRLVPMHCFFYEFLNLRSIWILFYRIRLGLCTSSQVFDRSILICFFFFPSYRNDVILFKSPQEKEMQRIKFEYGTFSFTVFFVYVFTSCVLGANTVLSTLFLKNSTLCPTYIATNWEFLSHSETN
jgi:hypothetical protein